MSEEPEAPNVIVPIEHQSAPKEHWIVEDMRKAAEDIDQGNFKPQLAEDDYFYYGPEQLLAMHPRMQEAIERLHDEIETAHDTQEALEKAQMLHEINEQLSKPNQWDGQGRWIGKENQEMRQGELLSPIDFMKRLWAVIGENRVFINSFAVEGRVALLVDNPEYAQVQLCASAPKPEFERIIRDTERQASGEQFKAIMRKLELSFAQAESKRYEPPPELKGKYQVATLQWPLGTEWMIMRFNAYGVPTSAKHLGWRTALLSMIMCGVLTEAEAHKAFPIKQLNSASIWYRAQLYALRNGVSADA
jgi:hypothetical protein